MIFLRRQEEIEKIRESGRIVAGALDLAEEAVRPGITTDTLDAMIEEYILSEGGVPSFKGYHGYPASSCLSINDVVVHGIPDKGRELKSGDIIGVDIGCYKNGYHGDAAKTFAVGEVEDRVILQMQVTREALYEGIQQARIGNKLGDISAAIQNRVEMHSFSIVRDLVGHGVGEKLHEDPQVPNYGRPGTGPSLKAGMVLALEPMVNAGSFAVETLKDGWTVVTKDGGLSTHFEHTITITETGPEVLTLSSKFGSFTEEVEKARAEARTRIG
ncbi:MAG: type I methionyl aminopeptidase [Candidatus Eisenbacteria bacterium]|uniref:Methionine aminopeptidase n=1 Tax=Eiseniibacteriota bacterium TaxID=2212470 RepID=A0A948RW98_UNCEI|nr:type I methionyl aminopeptidase [Candidatus Eisenbacteria bacterium]MBU1950608.1 type I methionyl aminopeptidase [Candidatus Eisenbacteria bacterium]MBU2691141.1 type I methionyl aminopeptidase [Candidatus Eisenbacteria bacterium]